MITKADALPDAGSDDSYPCELDCDKSVESHVPSEPKSRLDEP